jgi:uncharacterized membrane protein
MILILGLIGVSASTYLLSQTLDPSIPLVCPTNGFVDCAKVTSSIYSHLFGVPVALLGVLWFLGVLGATFSKTLSELLFPLWVIGLIFVGYLVFTELFLIHSICEYCTVVHIATVLLGYPVVKLTLKGE